MRVFAAACISLVVAGCSSSNRVDCQPQLSYAADVSGDAKACVLTLRNGGASVPIAIGDAPACLAPSGTGSDPVVVDCPAPISGLTCKRSSCGVGYISVLGTSQAATDAATLLGITLDRGSPAPQIGVLLTCDGVGVPLRLDKTNLQACPPL